MNLLKNLAVRVRRAKRNSKSDGCIQDEYHENYFIDKVLSMDSTPESSRVGSAYIHVSSLIGMCVRKYLLAYTTDLDRSEVVKPSMRLVWALGRAAETHVRTQFIEAVNKEGVVGKWKCKCGFLKMDGLYDDTLKCTRCSKKANVYTETALFDHEHCIVGSPDLIYIRPDNEKLMVVECKSINKKDFDALKSPKMDHVHQAMAYNELLRRSGANQDSSVSIVYVCKDFNFSSPYKEFRVERTADHDNVLDSMWSRAMEFVVQKKKHDNKQKVTYPKRLLACESQDMAYPQSCSFCGLCFSVK